MLSMRAFLVVLLLVLGLASTEVGAQPEDSPELPRVELGSVVLDEAVRDEASRAVVGRQDRETAVSSVVRLDTAAALTRLVELQENGKAGRPFAEIRLDADLVMRVTQVLPSDPPTEEPRRIPGLVPAPSVRADSVLGVLNNNGLAELRLYSVDGRDSFSLDVGDGTVLRSVRSETRQGTVDVVTRTFIPDDPHDDLAQEDGSSDASSGSGPGATGSDGGLVEEVVPADPAFAAASVAHYVEVLFLYTPQAVGLQGSLQNLIDDASVDLVNGNTALSRSGTNTRLSNLGFRAIDGIAASANATVLAQVRDPNDGVNDEIRLQRDLASADVVIVLDNITGACGRAAVLTPGLDSFIAFSENAMAVVDATNGCFARYTTSHEIGHLLGAGHEDATSSTRYYSDSRAFRVVGTTSTPGYRTMMAGFGGAGGCGTDSACPRILWFSTVAPAASYSGGPVGTSVRENDRAIDNEGGPRVSGLRFNNTERIGITSRPAGGYYTVTSRGLVRNHGGAPDKGDASGLALNAPIVGMELDVDGNGYYLVASDGGVFAYDAPFAGSAGSISLNEPIVDIAADPDGFGYWLIAADGGVFSYGANFYGSLGGITLNEPIVAAEQRPSGGGYWLLGLDGGVFAFGSAAFHGNALASNNSTGRPAVDIAADGNGGYWITSAFGVISDLGSADPLSNWTSSSRSEGTTSEHGNLVVGADSPVAARLNLVDRDGSIITRTP